MIITDGRHLTFVHEPAGCLALHNFAQSIGLKREWFQYHPRHPHYDITSKRMLAKAVRHGAVLLTARELVKAYFNVEDR